MEYNLFWRQPATGFTERTRGRTEEEIQAEEISRGFNFPHSYRDLMKLQNGGYLRKTTFFVDGKEMSLGAQMDRIPAEYYRNMREWLEESESEEEIQARSKTGYCYPERLVIISGLDGHEFMCLDYGWEQKDSLEKPELCFRYDDFEEYLRLPSFDTFLDKLIYYGHRCDGYLFGINLEITIEELADKFSKNLSIKLEERKNDNRYGWYNFEKWYFAIVNLDGNESLSIYLTPNKFVSDTYLFQSKPDTKYLVEIFPREESNTKIVSSSKYLKIIRTHLEKFELFYAMEELLIPADKEVASI